MKSPILASSTLAMAAAVALGLTAGGQGNVSKNQVPGPGVDNPSDPAAGNPGSRAQIPTAPQKQEDLYDSGSSGTSTGEAGSGAMQKPNSSDPSPSR